MKTFFCRCGQRIFFENTRCMICEKTLAFDPASGDMLSLSAGEVYFADQTYLVTENGKRYKSCKNLYDYQACNWLVDAESSEAFCVSCRLNQVIPNLSLTADSDKTLRHWVNVEKAKRRMLYGLLQLGLPFADKRTDPQHGLAFAFLEDQRHNPHVGEYLVLTGHHKGLITINLAEADDSYREQVRRDMGEAYRTVLGHFRHEIGHYYFERLVVAGGFIEEFRALFGDEQRDYAEALTQYYEQQLFANWQHDFVSAYAQVHPFEDWAECFGHYLHLQDVMDTAALQIVDADITEGFEDLTLALNELNRSLGLKDAYPFWLSPKTKQKLQFIHRLIEAFRQANPVAGAV
jgi:hypothetical protein